MATPAPVPLTTADIEIATRAADAFTRIYYAAYDSPSRLTELPKLYRPTSALTWNGTPFQGQDGVVSMVQNMPPTKHDIQSFDCHPIPGTQPPSLLIIVSGSVTHGLGPSGNPAGTSKQNKEGHPRVFSQTFMLVPDAAAPPPSKAGELAKYFVSADALRFVG
ncbi:NTF2 domain-containing protein [Mycena chlorophos]|uniref:NTF2 domain-containing protein n=1 Tax=Mycena chlorophos TaxID=658473 RepID=A0A8H6T2Y8_MYCCL|nr:NTF2 domain-containing protein [Mycena chlorophos]